MSVFQIFRIQRIPASLSSVWDFFADPANLPFITPPDMQFRVLSGDSAAAARREGPAGRGDSSPGGFQIYPGQIIEYTLRPLLGISVYWMTEIVQVRAPGVSNIITADAADGVAGLPGFCYFIDEQRRGPYSLWHHQHHFTEIPGGVEMCDNVHYRLPLGVLGNLAHTLLVRRRLEGIFRYRFEQVEKRFGAFPAGTGD